jgi:hypothetical protein
MRERSLEEDAIVVDFSRFAGWDARRKSAVKMRATRACEPLS